jgi:hypothetical protein
MSAELTLLGSWPEFSLLFERFQNANITLEQNSHLSQGLPTALFYIFPCVTFHHRRGGRRHHPHPQVQPRSAS